MPRRLVALTAAVAPALVGCGQAKVQRSSTPARVSAPATTSTSSQPTASGRVTGDDVPTRFGDIQVQLTLSHGRITDVQWLKLPFDRARSRFISQQAAPILRREVLTAQSARIDLLSGATYTSDAWATSVQSALSRAR
jgi:uncharacterized protein with FMN-binding domain